MRVLGGREAITSGQTMEIAETAAAWPDVRRRRWGQPEYWERRIDHAVAVAEAAECNRCITVAHQELALALHAVTGQGSGANFHTWAVWGSRKAGSTIRQEDVPWVRPLFAGVAAGATFGAGWSAPRPRLDPRLLLGGAAGAALTARGYAGMLLDRATARILAGNVTVLDDIGRQTGRFVSAFWKPEARTAENLERFLRALRPGAGPAGGQDLLRTAYTSYLQAAVAADPDHRDELMLLGNLNAILHEHWRLDAYIDTSLPRIFRRLVTHDMLDVTFGSEHLRIGRDIPVSGPEYPVTLATIEDPALEDFLTGPAGWDRSPDTTRGSGARDWTDIRDRMNFIVDLFRTRHHDPQVFSDPFPPTERDRILALDEVYG